MSRLYLFLGLLFCVTSTEAQQLQLGYVHADSLIWKMREAKELKLYRDTVIANLKNILEKYQKEIHRKYTDFIDFVARRGCEPTEHLSKEIEEMKKKLERKALEAEIALVYVENEIESYLQEELQRIARIYAQERGYTAILRSDSSMYRAPQAPFPCLDQPILQALQKRPAALIESSINLLKLEARKRLNIIR